MSQAVEPFKGDWVIGSGQSMAPTLPVGPTVYLVKRVAFKDLKSGDIVLYHNWMTYRKNGPFWTSHRITEKDWRGNWYVKGDGNPHKDFLLVTPSNYGGVILLRK